MPSVLRRSVLRGAAIVVGAVSAAGLGGAAIPSVAATPAAPLAGRAIGGQSAPQTPWAVQIVTTDRRWESTCTGNQINAEWILTARHCVDSSGATRIHFSNSVLNRGAGIAVDRKLIAPRGDVALMHLSQPHRSASYAQLDLGWAPTDGAGRIMGYGLRANKQRATGLYQADVDIRGTGRDVFGGEAARLRGVTGAANHGDSGGPLIVNGRVVAVCSRGADADPGANIHAISYYATLRQAKNWIAVTAGL